MSFKTFNYAVVVPKVSTPSRLIVEVPWGPYPIGDGNMPARAENVADLPGPHQQLYKCTVTRIGRGKGQTPLPLTEATKAQVTQ